MLTAWDKTKEVSLALPDFESAAQLGPLRERTRQGDLVCPTCRQLLWLHAGEILVPHFAHRRLSDCPQGRISEAILAARRLVYRFFQARIESGKLPAHIELEPVLPGIPDGASVDLVLRRESRPWVAIVLVESNWKPELRAQLRSAVEQRHHWVFRPVFLSARLKRTEDQEEFLLDTTQREFRQASAYDLRALAGWASPGTLHFVDTKASEWTSLRGLHLVHDPQVFAAHAVRFSPLEHLLWSEAHSDWVHPGEAEQLRALRESLKAKARAKAAAKRQPVPPPKPRPVEVPRERPVAEKVLKVSERVEPRLRAPVLPEPEPEPEPTPPPDPLPSWL
ncbi:MAG TPA: competence protein CoiA family protein, partial [Bacillota bacterium]|nr:competence protein CoiA family protein [Bacillota bacterium]